MLCSFASVILLYCVRESAFNPIRCNAEWLPSPCGAWEPFVDSELFAASLAALGLFVEVRRGQSDQLRELLLGAI